MKKGQAVIVVVTVLAMLFIAGVAFLALSQVERTTSLRHLDGLRARYIAEAGVVYAQKVLQLDRRTNLIDSFEDLTFTHFQGQDLDLDGDGQPESKWFNVSDSQGNFLGHFGLKISDEASKVHLNVCPRQALEQLFSLLGLDNSKLNNLLSRRPLNAIEELGSILKRQDFDKSFDFLTVYSNDLEIDLERNRRTYLNSPNPQVILEALLSKGVPEAHQKAANLKDAADRDLSQTILDKFALSNISPNELLEPGDWRKNENFYEAPAGGSAGKFIWSNLPVEDGEYFYSLYGPSSTDVAGEGLEEKVEVNAGSFTLNIKPAKESDSRFSHIELVSLDAKNGLNRKVISGTEALVINELMVKLTKDVLIDTSVEISSGESFVYTFNGLKAGDYYLIVKAKEVGGFVGDVSVGGESANELYDGDYFPYTVEVDKGGSLTLEIKNNSLHTSTFKGIKILQQPDGEFIELLNLSSEELDLSNFSFAVYSAQGEPIPGWPAQIPENTKLEPYQHLIFAVDNNDAASSPENLKGNKICFKKLWGFNAQGLIFDGAKNIDKTFDLLPDEGAKVILSNAAGERIDAVEYQSSVVREFISLERPDPTAKTDTDNDGVFDGWYVSESKEGATPALSNENSGMYTQDEDTGALIKHTPDEVKVFNRQLSDLKEVEELSSGENWEKFTLLDLALMADRFADASTNLVFTGHYQGGEFIEKRDIFESAHKGDTGLWEFLDISSASYLLSILSDDLNFSGEIQIAIITDEQAEFKIFSSLLFNQGVAFYGTVELLNSPAKLRLKIINDSEKRLGLREIQLEPVSAVAGRININTAGPEVLGSLFSSDKLAQTILENRPIGNKDERKLGVGELFLIDPDFLDFHNQLTVKSDIYEINSRGEYYSAGKIQAFQNIRTVVERPD